MRSQDGSLLPLGRRQSLRDIVQVLILHTVSSSNSCLIDARTGEWGIGLNLRMIDR